MSIGKISDDVIQKEKEYGDHIKECLTFAQRTADALMGQDDKELRKEIMRLIFDKCCFPHHYFIQDNGQDLHALPPSEKQIAYANGCPKPREAYETEAIR